MKVTVPRFTRSWSLRAWLVWNRIKWTLFGNLLLWNDRRRVEREFRKNIERQALEEDPPRLTDADERKLIEAELWGRNW